MPPHRPTLVYSIFVVVLVLAALDQTILSTALPAIARDLDGQARIAWVFSAYLIASTVVIPLYGKLADIHGTRPVLLVALALFLAGSLGCGLSGSMTQLVGARGLQGAGGGGLLTLTMLGVVDLYPPSSRSRYQALLGAAYGIATMFGPIFGGLLVQHLSWHWAFFINVPVALGAAAILAIAHRPTSARHAQRVDYLGALLLAASLVALLIATRHDSGLDSWSTALLGGTAAGLAIAFAWIERRVRHPLLPLTLFASGAFSAATAVSAASGVALFAAVVFLPIYLQAALGMTPIVSGLHVWPLMSGVTLAAIGGGRILRADGPVRLLALGGCVTMTFAFAALALMFRYCAQQPLLMSAGLLPLGAAIGLMLPIVTAVSQRTAPPQQMGIATATPIMVRSLGGAVGVSILGSMLASGLATQASGGLASAAGGGAAGFATLFANAIQPVYWSVAALCLLSCGAALWLPSRLAAHVVPAASPARPVHA